MKNFKSGLYKQQLKYKSFSPFFINKKFKLENDKINILNIDASRLLAELNTYSELIPDIDFFIKMNVIKEANKSNMIEGTRTEVDDIVLPSEEVNPEKKDDWNEVHNYIKAMNYSIDKLNNTPLSIRLLKDSHKILLASVRGKNKTPGKLRQSQNWIGGSSLTDAFFIPPTAKEVPDLLSDLEKFWHQNNNIPKLIKIAIIHYQFETIHPFLDGNGRLGRLLITLQLVDSKILTKPALYLSSFFEKNRASYYDSLNIVRKSNDLEQWIIFFLNGVITTSKDSINTFKKIINLRKKYNTKIITMGSRSKNAQKLLLYMFSKPIINIKTVEKELAISFNSANRLLKTLVDLKILKELTGFSRNRLFVLEEYLELFKK